MFSSTLPHLEVQVVLFSLRENRLQVMLVPGNGSWGLPGSPVPLDRSLEETAAQCLSHFIRKRRVFLEQLYTYGDPARRPERLVSVIYFALVPADAFCDTSSGAAPAGWFPVDALPTLSMDSGDVIAYALRRLRYKLEYTAAGFELLPEYFSLTELQQTYEMVLGEKLDKRNFRRRILEAGIIEPTTQRRSGEGRPALLYRYRPDAVAEVKARRLFP